MNLHELAREARPHDHSDWGSERQIAAQNLFFNEVTKVLSFARSAALDDYCMKANVDEMIDEALRLVTQQQAASDFADVLDILTDNDGACLYWQMMSDRAKAALKAGAVKQDGDLIVHPDAVMIEAGMAYTMKTEANLNALIDEYQIWNEANGLNLGSADEHLFDEALTDEQRAYLHDFCRRWEIVS